MTAHGRLLRARPTTLLAAALWLFILGLAVAIVTMKAHGWQGAGNTSDTSGVALFCALFAFATMGALVAAHVPRNPMGWIFLAIPVGGALAGITENVAYQGLVYRPGSIPAATAFGWVYSWGLVSDHRAARIRPAPLPDRRRAGAAVARRGGALGAVLVVMTLGYMFYPGPLDKDTRLPDNPLGIGLLKGVFDNSDRFASISVAGLVVAAVASVVVRFRRSRGDERQQMKWMAFAAAVLLTGFVVQGPLGLGDVAFAAAISMLPVALGIALFKYRLYDVDRVINRTLVYGASTALLGGAYVGLVIAGQALFSSAAGGSNLVVALSTLVVAALFLPVRARVQRFVDRRFYRSKVDAEATLARFGARVRREADLDTLLAELHNAVREALQPADVWLWLRPEEPKA